MSISLAICETECANALCCKYKKNILKVLVKDPSEYADAAEYEVFLPLSEALNAFDDKDGFKKRNRIKDDVETVYLDRLKDENDLAVLEKITKRTHTGWVDLSKVSDDVKEELIRTTVPEDQQSEWDYVSFEEMAEICASCKLSWDKGRGCVGSFGPDTTALPGIASKCGCSITASVPDGVLTKRTYNKDDAALLLSEIPILRDALEKEGKLAVKWYTGAADRLEAVARISLEEGCGFRFF